MLDSFEISESVRSREVDNELVLIKRDGDAFYGLDSVGREIWELLDQGMSTEMLVETLLSRYEADRDVIEKDLNELLQSLLGAGLIHLRQSK